MFTQKCKDAIRFIILWVSIASLILISIVLVRSCQHEQELRNRAIILENIDKTHKGFQEDWTQATQTLQKMHIELGEIIERNKQVDQARGKQ